MNRGDFWSADMFLVDDINVVTTTDRLDATAKWAMILGKRLATPSYLASPTKDCLMSSCSIKCRKAYTIKKLGWWMTSDVIAKHGDVCKSLARACEIPDSKWRVLTKPHMTDGKNPNHSQPRSVMLRVCETSNSTLENVPQWTSLQHQAASSTHLEGVFKAP